MKGLESLLNDDKPAPVPPPEPKKKEESAPAPPPEEPAPQPEPEQEPEPEEDDLDRPPPGTDARARESAAQVRARENGQKLKALETEHQETKLELERLRSELEVAKKAPQGSQNFRPDDFARHETVAPLIKEIQLERDSFAEVQEHTLVGQVVRNKFGTYMEKFIKAGAADETTGQAVKSELRQEILTDFKDAYVKAVGDGYDEDEMNREAKSHLSAMLQVLVKNSGKTQDIQNRISDLAEKARAGNLAQGVEVYSHHETDLRKSITGIAELPQTAIDENPHTVEATVAILIKQPEWKKRFDNVTNEVLQLMLGPKPLSQAELDGMNKGGLSVKEFVKNREKAFLGKRRKLAAQIAQALLIRGLWEQTSRDAAEHNDGKEVLDALSKSKPADPAPPPPPAKKKDAVSAIERHLTEEGWGLP